MSFLFELACHVVLFIVELVLHLIGDWVAHRLTGSVSWAGRRFIGIYDWIIG